MKSVIVDTCIWYALVDEKDVYAGCNEKIRQVLKHHVILVPYPSLYETINTKLIKNERKQADKLFGYLNNNEKVKLIMDDKYREEALSAVQFELKRGKHYSLVDMVIRLMMQDKSLGRVSVMTFNVKDFIGTGTGVEVVDPRTL